MAPDRPPGRSALGVWVVWELSDFLQGQPVTNVQHGYISSRSVSLLS